MTDDDKLRRRALRTLLWNLKDALNNMRAICVRGSDFADGTEECITFDRLRQEIENFETDSLALRDLEAATRPGSR
jgi:hypothetical protein